MIQPFSPNWNESNFLQVNHSQSQALTSSRDRSNRVATCSSCKQKENRRCVNGESQKYL